MRQKAIAGLTSLLRSRGITDPTVLQSDVQGTVDNLSQQWKGAVYQSVSTWDFTTYGKETLVEGVKGYGDVNFGYRQLYAGDACLVVNDKVLMSGHPSSTNNPFAWSAPGDAEMYRCPFLGNCLELTPAHFVILLGRNPLAMFGGRWSLKTTTNDDWIVESQVKQGPISPAKVEMSLSRSHDASPDRITIINPQDTETIKVLGYRRYEGEWVCEKAIYTKEMPGMDTVQQAFTLQSVTPSKPVTLDLTSNKMVEDYRLLGPDLIDPHQFVPTVSKIQASDVVYYPWNGQFPSMDELRALHDQQHPGEATPDPHGKASMLPGVGGLLCLVGGILMYRRRGTSV